MLTGACRTGQLHHIESASSMIPVRMIQLPPIALRSLSERVSLHKVAYRRGNKIQHRPGQTRIDADPEYVFHHEVRIFKIPNDAMLASRIGWLAQQVSAEEQAGSDAGILQGVSQFIASEGRFRADANGKS